MRKTFISKKRWKALEKKVADLEMKVQDQPLEIISALCDIRSKQMKKAKLPHQRKELQAIRSSKEFPKVDIESLTKELCKSIDDSISHILQE